MRVIRAVGESGGKGFEFFADRVGEGFQLRVSDQQQVGDNECRHWARSTHS